METLITVAILAVCVGLAVYFKISKGKQSQTGVPDAQNTSAASEADRGKPQADVDRPAEFNRKLNAAPALQDLIPEYDDDFYEDKTIASFGDDETMLSPEEDDEDELENQTLPLIAVEELVQRAVLTRCADHYRVVCTGENFSVGKSASMSDFVLPDNQKISRKHASFCEKDGKYYVIDSSKNGTSVNGKPVSSTQYTELRDGDRIIFADEEYIFSIEKE